MFHIYISYSTCRKQQQQQQHQQQPTTRTMDQSSQDFDEDLTQISQTQDDDGDYRRGLFKKLKMSGSKDLFEERTPEKRMEREEQSQYGSVILLGEVQRMQKENTSKETMSPRAVRRSFCLRFHRQLEEILQDMHPN